MPADPATLRIATEAEKIVFRWLKQKAHLQYELEYVFYPLLLGGINLGYLSVDFYIRSFVFGQPLAFRVRPEPAGSQASTEEKLIQFQESNGTVEIVRMNDSDVKSQTARTIRAALRGVEI